MILDIYNTALADKKAVKHCQKLVKLYNYFAKKWDYPTMYFDLINMTPNHACCPKKMPTDSLWHLYKTDWQNKVMLAINHKIYKDMYKIFAL